MEKSGGPSIVSGLYFLFYAKSVKRPRIELCSDRLCLTPIISNETLQLFSTVCGGGY